MATFPIEHVGETDKFNFTDALFHYVAKKRPEDAPSTVDKRAGVIENYFRGNTLPGERQPFFSKQKRGMPPVESRGDMLVKIKMMSLAPNIYQH